MSWTMEELMELATGYWRAGALMAAVELDLFAFLPDEGATAIEAAHGLQVSERHAAGLLTALAGLKLLQVDGDRFKLDPGAKSFLSPSGEMCLLDSLRFNADLYALWGRLAETVRSGRPAIPPGAHLGMDPERTKRFVRGMHSRALGMAPMMLPALNIPEQGRVLDVGAGPGTFNRSAGRVPAGRLVFRNREDRRLRLERGRRRGVVALRGVRAGHALDLYTWLDWERSFRSCRRSARKTAPAARLRADWRAPGADAVLPVGRGRDHGRGNQRLAGFCRGAVLDGGVCCCTTGG